MTTAPLTINYAVEKLPLFSRRGGSRVRFGEVVENVNETDSDPMAVGIDRYIGLEHLEPGSLHIRTWGDVAKGTTFTRRCRPGQVLFGKRRAYQRKVALAEFDAVVSGDIYVFAPKNDRLLPEMLPFLCLSEQFFQYAVGTSAGSLSPRTNWSSLSEFEFDLPSIDQQRRIAEILQAADRTVVEYQCAIQHLEAAASAHLSSLFGTAHRLTNQQRSLVKPLGEVALLQTGIAKGKKYPASVVTVESRYLRVANVQDGELDLSEVKTIVVSEPERHRYLLQAGDVVICEGGDFDKVGRGTIWRGEVPDCLHQNHVFCIRANHSLLLPEFLALQINSPYGKSYFLKCAKKTSNLASINSTQVKSFPLQLPSLKEQQIIVDACNRYDATRKAFKVHLKSSRFLFNQLREALV